MPLTARYWRGVTCRCPLGRWKKGNDPDLVSLEQYQWAHPQALDDARRHREALAEYARAQQEAGDLDRELGKVINRARKGG